MLADIIIYTCSLLSDNGSKTLLMNMGEVTNDEKGVTLMFKNMVNLQWVYHLEFTIYPQAYHECCF